jgi:hypothetical protein
MKCEIAVKSGICMAVIAMNITFSSHAWAIFLDEMMPHAYASSTIFKRIFGA